MKNLKIKFKLIFLAILFFGIFGMAKSSQAATINATSCSQADVQAAINSATTGDKVAVPAGYCTWTALNSWTAPVIIGTGKKITLQGQGIGTTIITSATLNYPLIEMRNSLGSRVTNFTFANGGIIYTGGRGWRIDHNRFEYDCSKGVILAGSITTYAPATSPGINVAGVIDHNEFHNTHIESMQGPAMGTHDRWARPLDLGTEEATYVETNTFTYSVCTTIQAIDENYGGAYVFRYNTIDDASIMAHPCGPQNASRAARKWEVYNNVWTKTTTAPGYGSFPGFMRGGTGVWFNNEFVGAWPNQIFLDNYYRACYPGTEPNPGTCNGGSLWDGNEPIDNATIYGAGSKGTGTHTGNGTDCTNNCAMMIDTTNALVVNSLAYVGVNAPGAYIYNVTKNANCQITANTATSVTCTLSGGADWDIGDEYKITDGYPCRDQIGRSTDQWLWTTSNPYPPQALEPAYAWNNFKYPTETDRINKTNGVVFGFQNKSDAGVCRNSIAHLKEGRDYVNNGTASKPGYTPYTYPHPLIAQWDGTTAPDTTPPAAPTGITVN